MKRFYSWKTAVAAARDAIDEDSISVLSLDIFDTILIRTTEPRLVIEGTCRWLAGRFGIDPAAVMAARLRAVNLLGATNLSHGLDPETPTAALFPVWIRLLAESILSQDDISSIAAETVAFELRSEELCLVPNPEVETLLAYAVERGVRTVAVSDMYLESGHLVELLTAHGIIHLLDQVVSSADFSSQKRTGRIFDIGLGEGGFYNGVRSARILHVGDDLTADGTMPQSKGMESYVVYDRDAMTSRNRAFYMHRDHRQLSIASALVARANSSSRDGTPICVFAQRLAEEETAVDDVAWPSAKFGILPFSKSISNEAMRRIGLRDIIMLQVRTLRRTLIKSPPVQTTIARFRH